jgi:hypothetical protein
MPRQKKQLLTTDLEEREKPNIEQVLVIKPDGSIDIPWITPRATRMVLAVFQTVSGASFPIKVLSGNIYCG